MQEIALQLKNKALYPFSPEDAEKLKDFKPNQILRGKIQGIRKERSVPQLRLLHACFNTVAENTEDKQWDTPEKVKIQIKHLLHFYKSTVVLPDGSIHFELASLAFANLSQIETNKICDRAFPLLARKINITVDTLLENAENN